MNFMVQWPAREISAHAESCLHTLVVAGKVYQRAIAHAFVKELGSFVPRAHFQGNGEYARDDGTFFEPLKKLASNTQATISRRHSEKVQVRVVIAVAHDRKAGNVTVHACDEYVDIGSANTSCYSHRCPTPAETVLNQVPRQIGKGWRVRRSRQSQRQL